MSNPTILLTTAAWEMLRPLGLPNFPSTASEFYAKLTKQATAPAETPSIPVLIDTLDFSRRTKLSLKTVRTLARSGAVPSIRVGRRIFFPASALMPKNTANHPGQAAGVNSNYNKPIEG